MVILVNIAYIFILISFSVKNLLWLRALNVVAGLLFIIYFALLPDPLWATIAWNALFGIVNIVAIAKEVASRRIPQLSAREQVTQQTHFSDLSLKASRALFDLASWESLPAGERLYQAGTLPDKLWLLLDGALQREGQTEKAVLEHGQLVGESAFLTKEASQSALSSSAGAELLSWPAEALRALMARDEEVRTLIQQRLGLALMA
ncbi:MAG: cyclic nucleotide-binding domain-containing protein [Myxococcota bacterium]|nr:cyclic nucleotide-binding domain-containing protein [Myxococcota bacterium]